MFRFGIPFIISCLLKCTLVLNTDSNTTCLDFYKMKGESMKTKSCTGEFIVSHCIPNVEHQEVDVCVQWKWITPGYCPYYDSTSNAIKEVRCSYYCLRRDDLKDICICSSKYAENASCKTTCRDDFKSYDYVFCEQEVLSTVTGSVPTTLSTTQKSVTYDKDNKTEVNEERDTDFGSALGIAFGVLITIILMVAAAVLLIKYGKMLENCGKGSEENMADIEAHPDEVRKPFLNEEEEKKKDEENERNDSKGYKQTLDFESNLTEDENSFECNEEEEKQDKENKWKDDGKTKILDEIREREWSSTQNTVEKAESESTETDENQSNEAGNKDKDVKLHALDNREESLIPKHVISTTSNQTPKSDINQEDSGNLQDDNKMSVCSTGGFEKEGGNSSEHKSDEKGRRNVTNAEDTGGSVDSFENNHGNENTVDPSNRLTEGSVDQDGNLDACKPIPDSIVETDNKEETYLEEEDTGGVFDDSLDSIKRKDDEEKGGSHDLHEFLEEVSTRLTKKILYRVLKSHVTEPQSYLTDESKISKVKELLPAEYRSYVGNDSMKSIPVMYAILQLSPGEEHRPKSGWGQGVKDRDTGVGDDIERLYQVHTLYREIDNPEQVSLAGYTRLFKVLFEAVDRLDVRGHCKEDYQKFIQKWENLQRNQLFKDNLKALQSFIKKWSLRSTGTD